MRIDLSETFLQGKWDMRDGRIVADDTCMRIDELINGYLKPIGNDITGWNRLYRDPEDGRLWELTYPQGELQGGGPPQLKFITLIEAKRKYGDAVA